MRAMWSAEPRGIRFDGHHYQLAGAPRPRTGTPDPGLDRREQAARARTHRTGRRRLGQPADELQAAGEAAEGNLVSTAPPARRAATRARSAASSTSRARSRARARGPRPTATRAIVGPPEHWAEIPTHFALDLGFSTFVLVAPPDPRDADRRSSRTSPRGSANASPSDARPLRSLRPRPWPPSTSPRTARGRTLYRIPARGPCADPPRSHRGWSVSRQRSWTGFPRPGAPRARGAEEQRPALAVPGELLALLRVRPHAPQRRGQAFLRRARGDQPGDRAGRRPAEGRPPGGVRLPRRGRRRRQSTVRERRATTLAVRSPMLSRCSRDTCSPTSSTRTITLPTRRDGSATSPRSGVLRDERARGSVR